MKKDTIDKQFELKKKSRHEIRREKFIKNAYKKRQKEIFTLYQPYSIVTEQFKILRALLLRLTKDKHIRTILVTSALPGEGKTFVSSNLAVSIAQGFDERVLLVDTDLRKPSIHELFNLKQEGLSDFLLSDEHRLCDLLHKTDIRNLSVLPAGSCPKNPSELLSSKKMKHFIQEARSCYDENCYIIFDSLPALLSEPIALAELVDGIILVVKAGKTGRNIVKNTIKTLGKERFLGVVLNYCWIPSKTYQGYYQYYMTKKKR